MSTSNIRKIVLAYSGGLDTSIIVPWLRDNYDAEVVCFTADIGQGDELAGLEEKALASGASKLVIKDLRDEFARDFLLPMLQSGAVYEKSYLLGTAIARPLTAKWQVTVAEEEGAEGLSHGCTGKGNDQVRFELTYKALNPTLRVVAPWRIWDIRSREDALRYAEQHDVPVAATVGSIYSRDRNLWHLSHEGGPLEDPALEPEAAMYQWVASPLDAPDEPEQVEIGFESGSPVSVNGESLAPVALIERLNALGARHGVGRVDMVENRLVGMKSRGVYETPGGTILAEAHRELEAICLDRDTLHFKEKLALRYAELIYFGKWYTALRRAMEAFIVDTQRNVNGWVRMKLYKGNVIVVGRDGPSSLYREDLATFGSDEIYDRADAKGFIDLFGLQIKTRAMLERDEAYATKPSSSKLTEVQRD